LFSGYPEAFHRYLPTFDLELIDLSTFSDQELLGLLSSSLFAPMLLQKYAGNPEALSKRIIQIFNSINPNLKITYFRAIFVYAAQVMNLKSEKMKEIVDQLPMKNKKNFISTYDLIIQEGQEKGEAIGIEKGKAIGIEKGKVIIIENCYKEGVPVKTAANISGMTEAEVSKIYLKLKK